MELIQKLDKEKRKFFSVQRDKILCSLTGHEISAGKSAFAALTAYANGNKFARALAKHTATQAVPSEQRQFLIDAATVESNPSNGDNASAKEDAKPSPSQRRLFCQLTCRFVSDTPADMARHVAGRRFQSALAAYKAALAAGRTFQPNTSLYKKYRSRMTLEGLAGAGGGDMDYDESNEESEDDSEEGAENGEEGTDNDEVEHGDSAEDAMTDAEESPPPPSKQQKQHFKRKIPVEQFQSQPSPGSDGKKRKKK